jgi:hypothetical protein
MLPAILLALAVALASSVTGGSPAAPDNASGSGQAVPMSPGGGGPMSPGGPVDGSPTGGEPV